MLVSVTAMVLTNCSNDDEDDVSVSIVGTWKLTSFESIGITSYIQFGDDGTCITVIVYDYTAIYDEDLLAYLGMEDVEIEVETMQWSQSGNTIVVDGDAATIVTLTSSDLVVTADGITSSYVRVDNSAIEQYL